MTEQNSKNIPEIYDMSVNNPLAQSFLEKNAFLKFLIQQIKQMITADGDVDGDLQKFNTFVGQINRVRSELLGIKDEIRDQIEDFRTKLEEINIRRRHSSQMIMQLTKERSNSEIDQDTYHHRKYELEMKRKGLGNQVQILQKNISIYTNLMQTVIPEDEFELIEEDLLAAEDTDLGDSLADSDFLMDDSGDGITYMGILAADLERTKSEKADQLARNEGDDAAMQHRLNIITETGKQYFFTLSPTRVVHIGRASQNDIQIPSPAVSRNHAEIVFESGHYVIVDLESSNGTFVNDKMVIRRKIEPNDTISIGGTRIIYLT